MRRTTALVVVACVATVALVSVASAKAPHKCSGTASSPGVLSGTFKSGVIVTGFCDVKNGPATVTGLLKLKPGSALAAAFGNNNSHLTVNGDVVVGHGATLILGCNTTSFTCFDETNMMAPTLSSKGRVTGSVTESAPLGVVIHNSKILGNVTETGGGGGVSCTPKGPFAAFMSPAYSDYEDNVIKGNVSITGLHACWLGLARLHAGHNVTLLNNKLADPDGIEILSNHVAKNLVCRRNGHPSGEPQGTQPVWDSAENQSNPMGAIFPRTAFPNTVKGHRVGQCVRSSPTTPTGQPGPKNSF